MVLFFSASFNTQKWMNIKWSAQKCNHPKPFYECVYSWLLPNPEKKMQQKKILQKNNDGEDGPVLRMWRRLATLVQTFLIFLKNPMAANSSPHVLFSVPASYNLFW